MMKVEKNHHGNVIQPFAHVLSLVVNSIVYVCLGGDDKSHIYIITVVFSFICC